MAKMPMCPIDEASVYDEEEAFEPELMAPSMGVKHSPLDFAGALGYATDEYEHIEEKDARSTAAEPTSTFRMTTTTASAGIILNQLRNGRRIDRSIEMARQLEVDGVVYFCHWGCKQTQAAAGHTTADMTFKHYVKGRQQSTNTAMQVARRYGLIN